MRTNLSYYIRGISLKQMKRKKYMLFSFVVVFFFLFPYLSKKHASAFGNSTIWQYQCIDTMKISRDAARDVGNSPDMTSRISWSIAQIKNIGATCVSIGTPYDDEFLPYLTAWVKEARKAHLHVWFRGNFSSWEGWFNYPKDSDPQHELDKTKQFILSHPDLFEDGDMFTPAPEAENGWNDGENVTSDTVTSFQQFLVNEKNYSADAFGKIGKHVTVNFLSMSGGVAKNVLNAQTIRALGGVVTLDHYVSSPDVMREYIDYFKNTYQARFMLGEFGAPIPDLNGNMTEDQQASFVDTVLQQVYKEGKSVIGVNYWVLEGGSTMLYNDDHTPRKVVAVLKKYYTPAVITGYVTDTLGRPLGGVSVKTSDAISQSLTDKSGWYRLVIPAEDSIIDFDRTKYRQAAREISISQGGNYTQNVSLEPYTQNIFYNLELMLHTFFEGQWLQIRALLPH